MPLFACNCGNMQDIAAEFWVGTKPSRQRKQRLVTIDGHQVLRENNYDLASVRSASPYSRVPCLLPTISCSVFDYGVDHCDNFCVPWRCAACIFVTAISS